MKINTLHEKVKIKDKTLSKGNKNHMINLKAILFSITVKLGAIHKVLTIK